MRTLAKLNPFILFFVPGMILWLVGAAVATLLYIQGPIRGFTIHTMIAGAMGVLIGFQLIILSFTINLFRIEGDDNSRSRVLTRLAATISHDIVIFLGTSSLFIGIVWSAILVRMWRLDETGQFLWTVPWVFALSLIVGGLQLIALSFILSVNKATQEEPSSQINHRNLLNINPT